MVGMENIVGQRVGTPRGDGAAAEAPIPIGVSGSPARSVVGWNTWAPIKRWCDLLATPLILALLLPLFAVVAALVKLDSPGPILYRVRRFGSGGREFWMYKFRSMFDDADERLAEILQSDPDLRKEYETNHKLRADPRVTRVGRILRKLSLDELPQLWNVVRGDMTLVGPRPYALHEQPLFQDRAATIWRVRPGLTGLWQVSGRNTLSFAERIELDASYVRHWSPWLDLQILLKTIPVVLRRDGAW